MYRLINYCIALLAIVASSCSVKYSFTGTSLSPEVKTVTIKDFPNRSELNNPVLSGYFSEELRNKFMRQTKLEQVNVNGDIQFEGEITNYRISAEAIQADDRAGLSRLTIEVKVKFVNQKDPTQDFEKSFVDFATFDAAGGLSAVETQLMEEITEKIIDKIFNDSVANW